MVRIGMISDIHGPLTKEGIEKALAILQHAGVDLLVLNGDIGDCHATLNGGIENIRTVIDTVGKRGLETYVQPGSHESITAYQSVVDILSTRYPNIIDAVRTPTSDIKGYRLAFLPGSVTLYRGAEYPLQRGVQTGDYTITAEGLRLFNAEEFTCLTNEGKDVTRVHCTNMDDLAKLVDDPERTVVFCHEPARFDDAKEHGVDFTYFAESPRGFIPGILLEREIKQREGRDNLSREELDRIAQSMGLTFKRENVGSKDLRAVFDDNGVRFAVNGHIHDASHRAHSRDGTPVAEQTVVNELFWNSGCYSFGLVGVLTLHDNGVSYQNLRWIE